MRGWRPPDRQPRFMVLGGNLPQFSTLISPAERIPVENWQR